MATNSSIAARAAAIATELAEHDHLPAVRYVGVYDDSFHLCVDGAYKTFEDVTKLAEWARAFDVVVSIETQWVAGSGRIHAMLPFACGPVEMGVHLSTAMAYELGRRLRIEPPERGAIEVTAEQLLTVLAADTETAVA
jgi:hypothetical protein